MTRRQKCWIFTKTYARNVSNVGLGFGTALLRAHRKIQSCYVRQLKGPRHNLDIRAAVWPELRHIQDRSNTASAILAT
jgi:hypothetical protein